MGMKLYRVTLPASPHLCLACEPSACKKELTTT